MSIQLLCHFDGINGSTTITDETGNITNFVCSGGAALSTSGQTFGTACLHINGGKVSSATTIDLADNDFTLRFRYTFDSSDLTGYKLLVNVGSVELLLDNGVLYLQFYFANTTNITLNLGTLSAGTYAISAERYGNLFSGYLNGTRIAQINETGYKISDPYIIEFGNNTVVGKLDELLLDNGVSYALGAASYTVETLPFEYYIVYLEKELVILTTAPLIKSLEILITAPLVKNLDIIITAPIEKGIIFINSANQSIEKELIIKVSANLPIENELIIKTAAASLDIVKPLVIKTYAVDSNKNTMIRWNG